MYCQLVYLQGCDPASIEHAVAELPETLDETYARILHNINRPNWELAHRLLQCVAVAFRPLRLRELADILAFDFKARPTPTFHKDLRTDDPLYAVLPTCSSLLAIVDVEGSSVIQFSHVSVKEFLTSARLARSKDEISRRYHISMTPAHTLIAQACLGTLLYLDENVTRESLQKLPLAEYAAEQWVDHACFETVSKNVEDGMKQLFDPSQPHLAMWVWIYDPIQRSLPSKRPRRPLLPGGTALHYAAHCGLPDIVKFLAIDHPQDVHSQGFDDKSTPIHMASINGHVEVVRILVEHGADAKAQDGMGRTALHVASAEGHVEVVRMLVEHGVGATAQDGKGLTPLHVASTWGHVDVVCVLVEYGADVATQDEHGWTPLHLALAWGRLEVARFLVEHGADATTQSRYGLTPLHMASAEGYMEGTWLYNM